MIEPCNNSFFEKLLNIKLHSLQNYYLSITLKIVLGTLISI